MADILKEHVLAHFGTQAAAAEALDITRQAIAMWPNDKPIPEIHALRLRYEIAPKVFGPKPKRRKAA